MKTFSLLTLPTAAAARDAFACAVKTGALEQAQKLLAGRHADRVRDALNFTDDCAAPEVEKVSGVAALPHELVQGSVVLHVSVHGNDSALGASNSPLKTLHEAQQRLRQLSPPQRSGARVELAEGTHFLDETLVFTAADSGTADKPVTWSAGAAVVSGGKRLDCQGKWSQRPDGVYECDLGGPAHFDSLFVAGARQVRARFPNGSPYVPKDGYAAGCQTTSTSMPGTALKKNMQVLASDGKTVISELCAYPLNKTSSVTVKDTLKARTVDPVFDQAVYEGTRFNDTSNYPFWLTPAPTSIVLPADLQGRSWQSPKGAVVKMIHPAGWGGWAFEVEHVEGSGNVTFSKGGFQEARGNSGCGDMYIENLKEELDSPGEWFLDSEDGKLFFMPPVDMTVAELQAAEVVAPVLPRLLQFRGDADSPAHDIILQGFNVTHAAPTYLDSYEAPSGGDWSIHRGGAVFLDGAERITLQSLVFDQVDGNAVFLSGHAVDNVVEKCDFWRTGDTAIALVGSVPLGDARKGTGAAWPVGNRISENWIEEVGVHMKQTSCVFRSLAEKSVIRGNVCYNGPRAGINFNDGFKGGDVLEGNVIFNMVRETGDHGTFNSWDRREYVFDCDDGGACFTPNTMHVRHNMFVGPAGWNMDHDDGSSQYDDFSNVVYLGGFKYRDGVMRNMTGNLMIQAAPAFQVTGFENNYWVDNMVVDTSASEICAPDNTASLTGTTYAVLNAPPSPPSPSPYPGWEATYCQSCENDEVLKDMGADYGSLVDCMSACGYEEGCAFLNYAEQSDHHCVLYKQCSPPATQSGCDESKHEWWTTWSKTDAKLTEPQSTGSCWTDSCICDTGKQIDISESDLVDLIRSTVNFQQSEAVHMDSILMV